MTEGEPGQVDPQFYFFARMLKSRYYPLTGTLIKQIETKGIDDTLLDHISNSLFAEGSLINSSIKKVYFEKASYDIGAKPCEVKINKDVDKSLLVNFDFNPALIDSSLKAFPSTYNANLGNLMAQYDSDRAGFLEKIARGEIKV
jgi:ethanolamine utilization protein EutQ (cupin superfamily)